MARNKDETGEGMVVYLPKILRTLTEICAEMGAGPETVRRWVQEGAPIAVEGEGVKRVYSAEAARLQAWREAACAGKG